MGLLFQRSVHAFSRFSEVYMRLFKQLGWQQVALLAEDGQEFPEYHAFLQDLFLSNNIRVIFHRKMPRDAGLEDARKVFFRYLIYICA